MTPFTYLKPRGFDEAVAMLAEHGPRTKVLAGGQSLLPALKERLARPSHVLSLSAVPGLRGIRYADGGELEIGPATTYAQLATTSFQGWHRQIGAVALNLADRSTRNLATIGGAACQADPRYDIPTLLVATGATLTLGSVHGTRVLPAAEFFDPAGGTALAANEILSRITFPPVSAFAFVGFEKFRFRVFDAAIVNVSLALGVAATNQVSSASLVFGGVSKCPSAAPQAAGRLIGQEIAALGTSAFDSRGMADAASEEVLPIATATTRHRQFQSELIKTLSMDLLTAAAAVGS